MLARHRIFGEDLDVRRDKIDVLISSANKCLHGVSGVSFLCVSPRVWPRIEAVEVPVPLVPMAKSLADREDRLSTI